jgi:hypothetical protein
VGYLFRAVSNQRNVHVSQQRDFSLEFMLDVHVVQVISTALNESNAFEWQYFSTFQLFLKCVFRGEANDMAHFSR